VMLTVSRHSVPSGMLRLPWFVTSEVDPIV
jgi:hypothetical protein